MRSRFRRPKQEADLDITAFMNLMVILVPFLLITAVFSQVSIVEMNLPQASDEDATPPKDLPPLQLEIVLRNDSLDVFDQPGSLLKRFPKTDPSYDTQGLRALLEQLKNRYPEEQAAMLLIEPDIAYDHLIMVMDAVRVTERKQGQKLIQYELFPEIAMGDAPEVGGKK